jgi:ketosteroid isomerase-like protein
MSQTNVELARAALAAFVEVDEALIDRRRLEEFFAPDAIANLSGVLNEETTLRGMDEFLAWRAAWMEPYEDWRYEPERILDAAGNRVVVTLYQRGKLRDTDSWVEMRYGLIYTVEAGLIRSADFYASPEQALRAAGLSE